MPQQLDATGQLVRVGDQLRGGRDAAAPGVKPVGDKVDRVAMSSEPVEQSQLARGLEEPLLVVLTVDLAQGRAEGRQPTDSHGSVVHAGDRSTIGADLATDDDDSVAGGHHLVHRVAGRQLGSVEDRLDARGGGIGAHLVAGGPGAEGQGDRIDHQRLAGAGLAGEDGEPIAERQAHRLDHRQVLDCQLAKCHQYGSRPALVRSRS